MSLIGAMPRSAPPAETSAYDAYRTRRHLASLDGIRCLSILAVLWHHSPHAYTVPSTRGFLGVDLFFVLSGYLITTLLLRERDATGTISLRAFYMRRSLRIFPLYYLVLFGQAAWLWHSKSGTAVANDYFAIFPYYATYTANWAAKENLFAHAWSLAVEEQFYLVWPPMLLWLGVRRSLALLLGLLAFNQVFDFGLFGEEWLDFARRMGGYSAIVIGVLLGISLHTPRVFERVYALVGKRQFIWLPLLALGGLVCVPGDLAGWPRLSIHLTMAVLVAAVVAPADHALSRLLRCKPAVHIGMVSYGMYLLHQLCFIAVGRLINRENDNVLPFFVLGTIVTVIVCTISFRTFEAFFMRLKKRFERQR